MNQNNNDNNINKNRELNLDDLFKPEYPPPPSTPYIPNISNLTNPMKPNSKSSTPSTSHILMNNSTPSNKIQSSSSLSSSSSKLSSLYTPLPTSVLSPSKCNNNSNLYNNEIRLNTPNENDIPTIPLSSNSNDNKNNNINMRMLKGISESRKAFDNNNDNNNDDVIEESLPGLESEFNPISPKSSSSIYSNGAVPLNKSILIDKNINRISDSCINNSLNKSLNKSVTNNDNDELNNALDVYIII